MYVLFLLTNFVSNNFPSYEYVVASELPAEMHVSHHAKCSLRLSEIKLYWFAVTDFSAHEDYQTLWK